MLTLQSVAQPGFAQGHTKQDAGVRGTLAIPLTDAREAVKEHIADYASVL